MIKKAFAAAVCFVSTGLWAENEGALTQGDESTSNGETHIEKMTTEGVDRYGVAATVSAEARAGLKRIYAYFSFRPSPQRPQSLEDWDNRKANLEKILTPFAQKLAKNLGVSVTEDTIGGVPVLRIRPPQFQPNGQTLLYTHGGGYVVLSAKSALSLPALIAVASNTEVISIDYTLAPRGNWQSATDEVLMVWKALLATGVNPSSVGIFGDSAGGGLAAGSVLKMRDKGLPLPGAMYLNSPWSDITFIGDTYTTLRDADPTLNTETLSWGANAYAKLKDQRHPYVSPVYGDYKKSFPPTLIQGGTREIFLSNFVRHYQAIRSGGNVAVLDLYEGMPHTFQGLLPDAPETQTAVKRAAAFFRKHLQYTAS